MLQYIKKFKWLITGCFFIVLTIISLPFLFPDFITQKVKEYANQHIKGNINFSDAQLSIIEHFPALTLSFEDFQLTGAAPFEQINLIKSDEIAFGIDVQELLKGKIHINKLFLDNAEINVLVDKKGHANYNVYESKPNNQTKKEEDTFIELKQIAINNAHIKYNDASAQVMVDALGFDYFGNGSLKNKIFEIKTKASIEAFDFTFKGEEYLKNKKVDADLVTKVNTQSLAFVFQQDNLMINKLPVDFTGNFDFLPNGYRMNFLIKTENSNLEDIFTALPPKLITWMEKTTLKGTTDAVLSLKGDFITDQNKKPNMKLDLNLKNGFIQYDGAPFPLEKFNTDLHIQLPQLNPELLSVKIPVIHFDIGKGHLNGKLETVGLSKPNIKANLDTDLDLNYLNQAIGFLPDYQLKGNLNTHLSIQGVLDTKQNKLPLTKAFCYLKDGYLKTPFYPKPIEKINAIVDLNIKKNLQTTQVILKPLRFFFEGQPLTIKANISDMTNAKYQVSANGGINFGKIYKVFGTKGHTIEGFAQGAVYLKGKQSDAQLGHYNKLINKGKFYLSNVRTTSEYLPLPFYITKGIFTFNNDQLQFTNFNAKYGHSNLKFNGYVQNIVNFLTQDKGVLKGQFQLQAPYLNVNEWMMPVNNKLKSNTSTKETIKGVVMLPKNLDLNFDASVDRILFDDLNIKCLQGKTKLKNGEITIANGSCLVIDSPVIFAGNYKAKNTKRAQFGMDLSVEEFDVKKAYKEIKLFREMATAAANAEGIISLKYQLKGILNDDMFPIFPSLQGGGVVGVKKVKLNGFKLLKAVSNSTGHSGIDSGEVNDFEIKTCIQNNLMEIDRFKFKIAGFRPRIEGTTSLDGKLALKMRLGLPPMGIIGIPLKIEGTKDKPKVRLGSKVNQLENEQYKEEGE
ncbi:AsmA family protein [Flavobacterium columnare]|uniref:AsmA-like C-terminal region-containing protein n=3 Tax=Flavobacterium TaxID=237 RepID=A0ABW8PR37_9FLAO|nr:AsmA-like C-terminal region-containing protein [Flavobacterium columnare]SPE77704.1 AsmA family protein [Flavobacterium columnare]